MLLLATEASDGRLGFTPVEPSHRDVKPLLRPQAGQSLFPLEAQGPVAAGGEAVFLGKTAPVEREGHVEQAVQVGRLPDVVLSWLRSKIGSVVSTPKAMPFMAATAPSLVPKSVGMTRAAGAAPRRVTAKRIRPRQAKRFIDDVRFFRVVAGGDLVGDIPRSAPATTLQEVILVGASLLATAGVSSRERLAWTVGRHL